ncbi:MAG: hypothetical protein UX17_C0059G0005 [Parcubacteria group bacterium GW2011_GWC2_45_7]|nr:MAG: hypothetical protein UX17_C0059G0005 [Parcubacteria group bacterium GW2011_GWC2_45_7]KKU73641.1 MAG: hypothetical protein UX98_C0005G0017 [Parcubacteria group bacterium GW2011_GWA2_47_26]
MEKREYQPPVVVEEYTVSPELTGRGVFYDVHETLKQNGELSEFVVKEFHLDLLFSRQAAADLFSKQEEEHDLVKKYFPEDMVPRTIFIVARDLEPQYEFAKLDASQIYPYSKFWQIQLNRRLAGRYGLDERFKNREGNLVNRAFRFIGQQIKKLRDREFTAALVQERINGISFAQLIARPDWKSEPNFETLRQNVARLIRGLRDMHEADPRAAYTWHSLASDNIMIETDDDGHITGRVVIIDTNFIQRPDQTYKKTVVNKLERQILRPLEKTFDLEAVKPHE